MTPFLRVQSALLLSLAAAVACGDDTSFISAGSDDSSTTDGPQGTSGPGTTRDAGGDLPSTTSGPGGGTDAVDDTGVDPPTGGDETTGDDVPEPLVWQTDCLAANYDLRRLHPDLECTAIDVPLDWDTPDGERINVAALRLPTTAPRRVGTFWTLDGGPGGSGLSYVLDAQWRDEIRDAGWDIIIPPHRGTFSPLLQCSASAQSPQCREALEATWGEGLQHFNTVEAARDVGEFIRRERRDRDEPVAVYGVSYGTYWAQFYASEFPGQASAIVLDSAVPTDADLALEEYLVQDTAEQLLQACVDDPQCGARVGFESGEEFSAAVLQAIDDGDCGGGDNGLWEDTDYRVVFGQLINRRRVRNYVPLLAALLTRCEPGLSLTATNAMNSLLNSFAAAPTPDGREFIGPARTQDPDPMGEGGIPPLEFRFSGPLQSVVIATTMLDPQATPAQVELDAERHFASLRFSTLMTLIQDNWDLLPKVEFERDFVSRTPMLVLNARYDLQTVFSWAEQVAEQHGAQLVEFADAHHGVALSNAGGKTPEGDPCARAIVLEFIADPSAAVDDGCAGTLPEIDVNLDRPDLSSISMSAFGTQDPWSLLPALD